MNPIVKQFNKKAAFTPLEIEVKISNRGGKRFLTAFTIVELLTVMSIIVVLIGLLVPSLNRVKRYARLVTQKNQFHSINVAMDLFNAEWEGYPDSGALEPYCGAMKLAEAMVGQDLKGFHPNSRFIRNDINLYPPISDTPDPVTYAENIKARKMYLPVENANPYVIGHLYEVTGPFDPCEVVLCDVYKNVTNLDTGKRVGMPILYYRANISNTRHEYSPPDNAGDIYNSNDNIRLIDLGMPWNSSAHPMASGGTTLSGATASPEIFYKNQ